MTITEIYTIIDYGKGETNMNYLDRMNQEIEELKNKMYKLTQKLNDENFRKEIGERKTALLIAQYNAMTTYMQILAIRIEEEKK